MLFNKTSNYSYSNIFIPICLELIVIQEMFFGRKVFCAYLYNLPNIRIVYRLARTGFEPVTLGLWVPCSTTKLPSLLCYSIGMSFLFNPLFKEIPLSKCFWWEWCLSIDVSCHRLVCQLFCIYRAFWRLMELASSNALMAEWLMQRAHNSSFSRTFLGSSPSQCII